MSNPPKSPAKRAPRVRRGRLKSVTYTGCWTCRSRKVKCDERYQNGCAACEKAGVPCAGYGVQLCWLTGTDQDRHGRRRRQIKLDRSISPGIPEQEINEILFMLDTVSRPTATVCLGPFSIFQSGVGVDNSPVYFPQTAPNEYSDGRNAFNELSGIDCDDDEYTSNSPRELSPQERIDFFPPDEARDEEDLYPDVDALGYSTTDHPGDFTETDFMASILADMDEPPAADEISTLSLIGPPTPISISSSLHLDLPLPLFRSMDTHLLLYHYLSHVAGLLQPVLHPRNPWRTTYFQFALEGCPELSVVQAGTPSSKVSTAIFHSVLSSAAFHLRNAKGGSKRFHKLGLQHKAKALRALNAALVHLSDSHLHTVYLTAILSLVTIDTMAGEDSDFPVHLNGCRHLRNSSYERDSDGPNRQVRSIYHFLTLLARTTSCRPLQQDGQYQPPLFEEPYFHEDDRNVEYIYGITPTLGNLLQRTCNIAEYLATHQPNKIPLRVSSACRALKSDILAWKLDSTCFHLMESSPTMIEIARCQAKAFHSAVLLFFCRMIGTGCSLNLDYEVYSIWKNLTDAEDLKDRYTSGEKLNGPMSFPAFIGACEATDRQPWVQWWTRVQAYQVGNFRRQWMVIREVWDIMDENDNVSDWREALRKSGRLVLPV